MSGDNIFKFFPTTFSTLDSGSPDRAGTEKTHILAYRPCATQHQFDVCHVRSVGRQGAEDLTSPTSVETPPEREKLPAALQKIDRIGGETAD